MHASIRRRASVFTRTALLLSAFLAGAVLAASAQALKTFSIPAGTADRSLKAFAEQSGVEILYSTEAVSGVHTNAVKGEFDPAQALDLILAGTELSAAFDKDSGVYKVSRAPAAAPSTAPSEKKNLTEAIEKASRTRSASGDEEDQTVILSPFVVSEEKDTGYIATSTMSGTRLKSKIQDIPAAISVVTKEQINDLAAVDINDVFMYEASTEGIYQWTSFTNDRGTVSDDIQTNPQGSTRMRGLSAANVALDLFPSALPFDTYNVDSIEISRGPNSSIFGIGNTGGTVNVNQAKANLAQQIETLTLRGDSYGGYRGSFDVNLPVVKDRFALRTVALYNANGFTRKPSSDVTRRLTQMVTLHPFRSTTIRGSFESYRNFSNRPNSMTPEDGITDWVNSGKPSYNPLTQTVTYANGASQVVSTANETALLPMSISPINTAFTQYPSWYIDGGAIQLAEIDQVPSSTGTGPNNVSGTNHLLQDTSFYERYTSTYPLYRTPGITNKGLYDWTSVNLASPNYASTKGETAQIQLEQFLLNSPTQTLALQLGWQGQRTSTDSRDFLGSYSGGKYQVLVDIDQYLLDGSPNPFYLRPYLGASQPAYSKGYNNSNVFRATMAYELNLTERTDWLKWLGRQRITGYGEYDAYKTASLGFKDTLASWEPWMSASGANPSSRNSAAYRQYVQYYVGDTNGYNVDYGPKGLPETPFQTQLKYYNAATKTWVEDDNAVYDPYYYANRPNKRLLSTFGGVWQGFFWGDRIIPTIGLRHDFNRTRDTNSAINPTSATNGFYDLSSQNSYTAYDWVEDSGDTYSQGVVVKPLKWLGLMYNQSDSFTPGTLAYDIDGSPLPDPHGKTRDYGFELDLFNGRLVLRAQQYETTDFSRGSSTINTIVQRAIRMDYSQGSGDPNLTSWLSNEYTLANPNWSSDQVYAAVVKATGIDPNTEALTYNKTHGDQTIANSHGKELEIEYNPTKYWTMKLTGSDTLAFNGMMSGELQSYLAQRMPIWTSIVGPYTGKTWWTNAYSGTTTPYSWYTTNVLSQLDLQIATQGKQITQTRQWHLNYVTKYKLAGLGLGNWLKNLDVGGAVRWESKASIGYYGATPDSDGVVRLYDPNRPIWDHGNTYFDCSAGYNLKMDQGKIPVRIQLNVRNVFENGHLQAVAANPDGTPWAFRIVDPRQIFLTTTFSL